MEGKAKWGAPAPTDGENLVLRRGLSAAAIKPYLRAGVADQGSADATGTLACSGVEDQLLSWITIVVRRKSGTVGVPLQWRKAPAYETK